MSFAMTLKRLSYIFSVFLAVYFFAYTYLFITGGLFYFGEAVSYEGLLRILQSLKYATLPNEIPLSLTPYTPLFLSPLVLLGRLLGLTQVAEVSILVRSYHWLLLMGLFLFINLIRKSFFSEDSSGASFFWMAVTVFFYSPTMEMALRPDTLSFFCEAIGVFYIFKFLRFSKSKHLILASLLSGFAMAIKANTIGAIAGISVYFLVSGEFKNGLKYFLGVSLSGLSLLVLQYGLLGDVLLLNIFQSIQSVILPWHSAVEVYMKLFDLFLFPLSFYLFLVIFGLAHFTQRKERLLFSFILLGSFLFAFVGQLKWGAFHNYFLSTLYLGLIPASLGFFSLTKNKNASQVTGVFLFQFFFIALLCIRGTSVPIKILADRPYFTEVKKLRTVISEKIPQGFIYTNDEQLHLALVDKMAIGVLSEELLQVTPKLQSYIPKLQNRFQTTHRHAAFIFLCEAFNKGPVSSALLGSISLVNLQKIQTGRYCLFY